MCPLCLNKLKLVFHSKKRQSIKYEENNILITFPMGSINKNQKSYKVGFSFDPKNNSFFIDFFTERGEKFEIVPLSLLKKFTSFNTNLGAYKFYKVCDYCHNYHYTSNYFNLDLSNHNIGDLTVHTEKFCLFKPWNDEFKSFIMINNYHLNKTTLTVSTSKEINQCTKMLSQDIYDNIFELDLLKFTSKDEMINRLNRLLLFS